VIFDANFVTLAIFIASSSAMKTALQSVTKIAQKWYVKTS